MPLGDATVAAAAETNWLGSISLALALSAFVLSCLTFRRGKAVDRRNVFIEIHRQLLEPDLVAARRLLYKLRSLADVENLSNQGDEQMTHIYRLLAMFDLLGFYAESKWVDEGTVLEEWGDTLNRSRQPAEHVLAWRRQVTDGPTWPHYQRLAQAAADLVAARAPSRA